MSSVYHINKGINKPIEFKGLRAQYIAYLAIGLVVLLICFAVLYIAGLNLFILLPLILGLGAALFFTVYHLSHKFGQHGLMKRFAKRNVPEYLKINSRKVFIRLKKEANDTY